MSLEASDLIRTVAVGVCATLLMDIWNFILKSLFDIRSLDYCLLGRWLLHMPGGTFRHVSIAVAPPKPRECAAGWMAHYTTGVLFAFVFVEVFVSPAWLERPKILPALLYGISTVVFPLFVMQPALGLGMASSRAPRPAQARLKSLCTHTIFGLGLYVCALGLSYAH